MVQSHNSGATKNTILVVDDSITVRSMVQSFLSQDEFNVQVAKNGQECLAQIHEHCPDILLLDVIMPGMTGYEVYARLREQPEYADLPVVIMSGSEMEALNKFAESKIEQKFVFLLKPFNPETLKKKIALALELQLVSKTVEESVVSEEILLKLAPSHETTLAEEATIVLKDEPQFQEEVVVSHKTVLPKVMVLNELVHSTPSLEPAEKTLVAQTSKETAEISKPQVSKETMSPKDIHQKPAHMFWQPLRTFLKQLWIRLGRLLMQNR
jgi:twitching motility two-component system response regulator PilH